MLPYQNSVFSPCFPYLDTFQTHVSLRNFTIPITHGNFYKSQGLFM